jgi:hypothetical protein
MVGFGGIITKGLGTNQNIITQGYGSALPVKIKTMILAEECYLIEVCPVCDIVLQNNMYTVNDSWGKRRFCRHCHTELEYGNRGWIQKKAWWE